MDATATLPTRHAPAERDDDAAIRSQHQAFLDYRCTRMIDALPTLVLILNEHRQAVFANAAFLNLMSLTDMNPLLGRRPGEILRCVRTLGGENCGCGTTEFCRTCGAVKSILAGLAGKRDVQECRMTRLAGGRMEALDLLVSSTPFELGGRTYVVFAVRDISHEKRRNALEHIFFHDILNTAGGLREISALIADEAPAGVESLAEVARDTSARLVEGILVQRDLALAESNELAPQIGSVSAVEALNFVWRVFAPQKIAQGRTIVLDPATADVQLATDAKLLHRVLGNLVKNALEAVEPGRTVTLGCEAKDGRAVLWVHNPGLMPREVQLQIFSRSFSTKAASRGLGTYSVKLLTERYLKGEAGFTSDAASGTRFFVDLPLKPA
jgi:signal transduction histidine kinase